MSSLGPIALGWYLENRYLDVIFSVDTILKAYDLKELTCVVFGFFTTRALKTCLSFEIIAGH